MGATSMLTLLLTHPIEFRTLLQYKVWHEPKRDITQVSEHPTSGWDRPTMRRCWEFLDQTSRSFSGVIKELEGDLARVVSTQLFIRPLSRSNKFLPVHRIGQRCIIRKWFHSHSQFKEGS